ncbi:MAG: potassium transporter [Gammaproteobacteria bacterium]|nr:potassium transporter [Gammaproteobacteria bacterium]
MRFTNITRVIGLLLALFSLTMLAPLAISVATADGAGGAFLIAFATLLIGGLAVWWPLRRVRRELRLRDGFVIVTVFWVGLGLAGAIPLALAHQPHMSIADAIFESISGLTTTGATVITGIDTLPASILFYRQLLQWLGGLGIIVLAVAILPMLGVGGMQLYRAETPGPMKDAKLTPRITETAKALWYVYLALTAACAAAYLFAGMPLFDAVGHAFSTIAIGGFSTHDASLGYYDSPLIEMVAVVFMFLAGMNFALHFTAFRNRDIRPYLLDSEVRAYAVILLGVSILVCVFLIAHGTYDSAAEAIRHGLFQAVSIGTTTGYTTTAFVHWPGLLPVVLLFASFIGGCAGSTSGGLKVIRVLLLAKQGGREIHRLVHPAAVKPIKLGTRPVPDRIIDAVWGFFAAYVASFAVVMLALLATGMDQVTAFSATGACINNLGPGLGDVAVHYGQIGTTAKLVLSFAMLLGRLEIFTLLVVLTPTFWRG